MKVSQPRTVFCSACWTQASPSGSQILKRRLRLQLPRAGKIRTPRLRPKQAPQSTQRYLHRAAARTAVGFVLVGSSYEYFRCEGRFHDWNSRSDGGLNHCRQVQVGDSSQSSIMTANQHSLRDPACVHRGRFTIIGRVFVVMRRGRFVPPREHTVPEERPRYAVPGASACRELQLDGFEESHGTQSSTGSRACSEV